MNRSTAELAKLFSVDVAATPNVAGEIYPGYPGLVLAEGSIRSMVWGFPLARKSKKTGNPLKPKPVNNTRADKLDSFFWRSSFEHRRCLIPVSAFAEAEGATGAKTRTWFAHPDGDELICAGIWRSSDEWGDSFSMIMTDANATVAPVHDRMPVILAPADRDGWLDADPDQARALCRPFAGKLAIDRTSDRWHRG